MVDAWVLLKGPVRKDDLPRFRGVVWTAFDAVHWASDVAGEYIQLEGEFLGDDSPIEFPDGTKKRWREGDAELEAFLDAGFKDDPEEFPEDPAITAETMICDIVDGKGKVLIPAFVIVQPHDFTDTFDEMPEDVMEDIKTIWEETEAMDGTLATGKLPENASPRASALILNLKQGIVGRRQDQVREAIEDLRGVEIQALGVSFNAGKSIVASQREGFSSIAVLYVSLLELELARRDLVQQFGDVSVDHTLDALKAIVLEDIAAKDPQ